MVAVPARAFPEAMACGPARCARDRYTVPKPAIPMTWLSCAAVVTRPLASAAFAAAWHLLPPRQRAILILREVLELPAAEAVDLLAITPAAVNSALQRARGRLAGVAEDQIDEPAKPDLRATVDSYVPAFENADITALTRLLTAEAILEMPPMAVWYAGRENYGRFITRVWAMRGTDWRMRPAAANGQPAVAAYVRGDDGTTCTGCRCSRSPVPGSAATWCSPTPACSPRSAWPPGWTWPSPPRRRRAGAR
jgi:hypothetical protein